MTGAVVYILSNTSGVYSLVGGTAALARVYSVYAPATVTMPYVIVELDGDDPSDTKTGVSKLDQGQISVTAIAEEYGDADDLAAVIRTALDRYSATVTSGSSSWVIQSIQFIDKTEDIGTGTGDEGVVLIEQRFKVREDLS